MSITAKKIINSVILIAFVVLLAALAYRFTGGERKLLTGSILMEGVDVEYINSIEFADPSGTAFPVNNEVTINSVYVDFKECSDFTSDTCPLTAGCEVASSNCIGDMVYDDGVLTGDNLNTAPVTFYSDSLPADVDISGNEIALPDTFEDFELDIKYLDTQVNISPLNISSVDCSYLDASLMMATGEGVYTGDPEALPKPATSETFDFAQTASVGQGASVDISFADLYSDSRELRQIVIENPVDSGDTFGSKPFTLTVDFNDSVTGYQVNVCTGDPGCELYTTEEACVSASCTWSPCNMNTSDSCSITVDDYGSMDDIVTRFVNAINSMAYSAFSASNDSVDVTLTAAEEGVHTNVYTYDAVFDNLGEQECAGLEEAPCGSAGCNWDDPDCTGEPCETFDDTSCLDLDDSVECLWDGFECSLITEDPFTLNCSDLGGCFEDGEDAEPLSVENIVLTNTTSNPEYETGHQIFNLNIDFDSGITGQAMLSGDTVIVKDEGLNTHDTALNFAYVFNNLLGDDSPFFASIDPLNTSGVVLTTKELGLHTNYYTCNVNALPFPDSTAYCFSGGDTGTADVLVAPLTLDNNITQGEVVLVYAEGSVGENIWLSSDPSIIEVAALGEIDQVEEGSSASFLEAPLTGTEDVKVYEGTYTKGEREDIYNEEEPPEIIETRYPVTMTVPVEYDVATSLSSIVTVEGTDYTVPLEVDGKLYGNLTGSGTWSDVDGLNILLAGTLSGVVQGYASGEVEGMVHGSITVDVTANASMTAGFEIANLGVGTTVPTIDAVSGGTIEADGSFTSTITKVEEISTDIAVLYAKRPGTTLLHVTDSKNCTANLSVTTVPLEVILEMEGAEPGDIFDVGDDVQINAYIGTAGGDFSTMDEITTSSRIEWFSGNPVVADFGANDGLLSILAPGTTNITAHFDTDKAEIGTIESDALQIKADKIDALTIVPNKNTQAIMPIEVVNSAYENVLLAIHNPDAVGSTVVVEGTTINITLPDGEYDNELAEVEAITANIAAEIPSTVAVTQSTSYPGVLQLLPDASNANGRVDISSTASSVKLSIIPDFGESIVLPSSEIYGMMVVAEYESGKTKRLDPGEVSWVNNPFNLDDTKLLTGLLQSVIYEDSTLKAEYMNANGVKASSQIITIVSESGPVIEFVKRIGSTPITKGSQMNLQMKVTDVDTVGDIEDISIYLVKSDYFTYSEINGDTSAVWFDATSYPDQITVEDEGEVGEGEEASSPDPTQQLVFKTYNLQVGIPNASNLFDGYYKLLISVTDSKANTINYVYPIYIGEIATGDVTGDGKITISDVFLAYQIYTGAVSPTQAQLQAANVNGKGGVTLVDVMLLWQQVAAL